jgi:glycosyltransferase involved in cell wall biosynthesis
MSHRILLYTDDSGEGGVASYNHSLLCHLATLSYQIFHAQGAGENLLIRHQIELGIHQVNLGFTAGQDFTRSVKDFDGARSILSEVSPDLIVFSDGWAFSNLAAKQAAIELGLPYVTVMHWIEPSCAGFSYGDGVPYIDAVSYYYSQAKAVIAVSQNTLDLMQKVFKIPKDKVQVIHNGISANYFAAPVASTREAVRQELGVPSEAVVCLTSARLVKVKGHRYQLEAIQHLRESEIWHQLYFLWAGTGAGNKYIDIEAQLKESVRQMGVGDRVKFLGQRSDISALLDASDIFVLTSDAEGMPLSIMEAMAKGLPVIATAVSGVPEELGATGKLLPDPTLDAAATVEALTTTLQAWAADTTLRENIGQACKRRAEDLFTDIRMVRETTEVIEQALLSRSIPPADLPDSAWLQILSNRLRYGALTWKAWQMYCGGEAIAMSHLLQSALRITPFTPAETVLNWVESFARFSAERGDRLDTYALVHSAVWEQTMRSVRLASRSQSVG